MKLKTYKGLLCLHNFGEASKILYLSSLQEPLASVLNDDITYKKVSAHYWITDKEVSKEEAIKQHVKRLYGFADCSFGSHYSELTGYLWTDEEIKIGGHDLINELRQFIGKWLILEITIL